MRYLVSNLWQACHVLWHHGVARWNLLEVEHEELEQELHQKVPRFDDGDHTGPEQHAHVATDCAWIKR